MVAPRDGQAPGPHEPARVPDEGPGADMATMTWQVGWLCGLALLWVAGCAVSPAPPAPAALSLTAVNGSLVVVQATGTAVARDAFATMTMAALTLTAIAEEP